MSVGTETEPWAQPILSAAEVGEFEARIFGGDETQTREWSASGALARSASSAKAWAAMQAAGRALADAVLRDFEGIGGFPKNAGRLLVLVGKGHNGGDALIAAEAILGKYPSVVADFVFVFGEPALRPLARRAWLSLQTRFPERMQVLARRGLSERVTTHQSAHLAVHGEVKRGSRHMEPKAPLACGGEAPTAGSEFFTTGAPYALCLDGVFGFQFRPPLDSGTASVLAAAGALSVGLRAAVDLPSGLGEAGAFRADFTYATGVLKREALGLRNAGRLRYLDLGFFKNANPESRSAERVITAEVLAPLRGWRDPHSDKRAQGHVFVLAGSREYPGAALMCVLAALRSGAGLVTAFVPEAFVSSFAASVPEAIWVGWPETPNGGLALEGEYLLRERLARAGEKRALVIGPGIGRERETQVLVGEVLKTYSGELPVLLDADALQPEFLEKTRGPLVLTPHAGEFRRLSAAEPSDASLRDFAQRVGAVVVLKGPVTRVCDGSPRRDSCLNRGVSGEGSGEREGASALPVYHSLLGGPVLARGGTGDLLAGMIGAQLAREPSAILEASCRAVAWHGLAAEALERAQGAETVRTTELLNYLSLALRS